MALPDVTSGENESSADRVSNPLSRKLNKLLEARLDTDKVIKFSIFHLENIELQ